MAPSFPFAPPSFVPLVKPLGSFRPACPLFPRPGVHCSPRAAPAVWSPPRTPPAPRTPASGPGLACGPVPTRRLLPLQPAHRAGSSLQAQRSLHLSEPPGFSPGGPGRHLLTLERSAGVAPESLPQCTWVTCALLSTMPVPRCPLSPNCDNASCPSL